MSRPTGLPLSHTAGVLLVTTSAIVFSTAGIFTKGVDANAWSVIFWRGLGAAVLSFGYLWLRGGLRDEISRFGWSALLATLVAASGTAAFIPAFKLTSVTNVVLIWATAPFVAAALTWVLIGERPTLRITLTSLLALVGVGLTLKGSVGTGNLTGDFLALWMTLMMSVFYVIYRIWPDTPTILPNIFASVILLVPGGLWGAPMTTTRPEIGTLLAFGLIFAVASITLTEGARRIPAAQTALLGAIETPLAPIWAWLLLRELPTPWAIAGGILVIVAVVLSQYPLPGRKFKGVSHGH
ncbi:MULTISPECIES: DMT family transporter [unclassified Roseovarius]|uniref:DMT family transporter n=1 Tax=unclassified Roseovarius TaxID=2614913 RepID=UPI00273E2D02|nr:MULTISPECIES: DMT family transporter [unclassified Roseovarius]